MYCIGGVSHHTLSVKKSIQCKFQIVPLTKGINLISYKLQHVYNVCFLLHAVFNASPFSMAACIIITNYDPLPCTPNEDQGVHFDHKLEARLLVLLVNALVFGSISPIVSPGRGHCVVFLGRTLKFHSASVHPGTCVNGYQQIQCWR